MEKKIKVSIVVPIYKAEKYLRRCVDSILVQTFPDFEVVLVDDGSPDGSGDICEDYAKADERVRVLHKENGGVTSARACGVQHAVGEYVFFVDADDDIPYDALQSLIDEAQADEYDVIIGRIGSNAYVKETLSVEEYRSYCIIGGGVASSPCGKLFRRSLFTDDTFDIPRTIVMGEDMLMNIRIAFANTKPVRFVDCKVYNYFNNLQSCTHTFQTSLEYEMLFDKYRNLSIPEAERERYIRECVQSKINGLMLMADATCKNTWAGRPYFKELETEVKSHSIRVPLITRIKLYTTSPFLMKMLIKAERLNNRIAGLISRR